METTTNDDDVIHFRIIEKKKNQIQVRLGGTIITRAYTSKRKWVEQINYIHNIVRLLQHWGRVGGSIYILPPRRIYYVLGMSWEYRGIGLSLYPGII